MSEDEVKGKAEKVTGKIREEVGKATGSPKEQIKGKAKQWEGETRETAGKAKRKMDEDET